MTDPLTQLPPPSVGRRCAVLRSAMHPTKAMDAAEARRAADREAFRAGQLAKYAAAGGLSMERRLETEAK